jgi:cytochrome c553
MTPRMRIPVLVVSAILVSAVASSCADPVHDELVTSLGPEDPSIPQGEYHRAGQPCTACHGGEGPAKTQFSLAGTIFWSGGVSVNSSSVVGVNDATVSVVDSLDTRTYIQTNCVGNFFVRQGDYVPAFPILVGVYAGPNNQYAATMGTQISRATSCAECHFDPVNYNAVGHIFMQGGAPPADQLAANSTCPVDPNLADSPSAALP